jgi:hypothetical protein
MRLTAPGSPMSERGALQKGRGGGRGGVASSSGQRAQGRGGQEAHGQQHLGSHLHSPAAAALVASASASATASTSSGGGAPAPCCTHPETAMSKG